MTQPLTASLMVTGSTSLRLAWADLPGVSSYQVFRATTNAQPGLPLVTVAAGVGVFNDHGDDLNPKGLLANTLYYYWVEDQTNALIAGPLSATTDKASVKGPMLEDIKDALSAWVLQVTGFDPVSVQWADQEAPKPPAPAAILDMTGPINAGLTASKEKKSEALGNLEQWAVSIQVYTKVVDPNKILTDAMQYVRDLRASMFDPAVTGALNDAGIGIADIQATQNLSTALETGFERRGVLDFDINIRYVYPLTPPVTIESVTPITSTVTP